MPFPTFVRGYFQKGKKDMKKRKRTDSYPVAPFTIFDVANMLDMEFFGKLQKWISGKGCPECSQCCLSILWRCKGGRQASVSVQKGKSLMFSIALIVELVIIC